MHTFRHDSGINQHPWRESVPAVLFNQNAVTKTEIKVESKKQTTRV